MLSVLSLAEPQERLISEARRELSLASSLASLLFSAMSSLSHAAALALASLEKRTRDDGSTFYAQSSNAPSWLHDLIHEAHNGELPNDARYELIRDALSSLSDHAVESEEEALDSGLISELSLDLLPHASSSLFSWFAAHGCRIASIDEALESGRISELSSHEIIAEGWRVDCEEMLSSIVSSLEEARLSVFNSDTDCELLLSDSHGIHIPKLWADDITDQEEAEALMIDWADVLILQSGPDHEQYWEAWSQVLDHASWSDLNGREWRMVQNGDLWAVDASVEIPEEWLA